MPRRNDDIGLQLLELFQLLGIQAFRIFSLQFGQLLGQGIIHVLFVANRSLARGGHDLRLIPIGIHMREIVRDHILRLGLNGRVRLQVGDL